MARLMTPLVVLLLAVAACGTDDDAGAPDTTTTTDGTTTTAPEPGGALEECSGPAGFTLSAPADWETNEGEVVPACTMFSPEPFEVEEGTDARVAPITAYIDPVAFSEAAAPREGRVEDRAVTVAGGRQAVRLSYEIGDGGLYPEDTPITVYMVDVQPELGEPATLFVDTVGVGDFEYETNRAVLDRMFRTLELDGLDVETDPAVIAAYRGGGGGFSVTADVTGDQVCLGIPPGGEPVCTEQPAADQVHTVALRDREATVQAGVTGEDVWRVDLVTPGGETHSSLPAAVRGSDARAYAFPDTVEDFRRLVLRDITGQELRTIEPGAA